MVIFALTTGGEIMSAMLIIATVLASFLMIYLVVALLKPELFS
jgi:K+-transporting ATPase KdpF subunit